MSEDIWYKYYLKEFCFEDPTDPLLTAKPVPMLWSYYFISSMKLDKQRGFDFSKKCVTIIYQLLEESLTTLQDLVLKGDVATTEYQVQRQAAQAPKDGEEHKAIHEQDKSVLHYAVLSGNVPMVQMLLSAGYMPELNAPDLITAFTPLHMAVFIENRDMMWTLISHGAKPDLLDAYRGTALDYARIMQLMPHKYQKQRDNMQIKVYDDKLGKIQPWSVKQFEDKFQVTWCADWTATNEYVEELLFGGFSLGNPDMEFREQYMPAINASSGDENIVIAEISPQVGWGAFAARDIKKGEFIVKYGGQVMIKKGVKDRSYSMQSGLEGFILNSKHCRNTGAFLNHSSTPNAQAECVFEKGIEQAVILAIEDIPRGKQLFIDYSERYFSKGVDMNAFSDMNTGQSGEFPTYLPSTAFS